ncbi:MAG: M28 family peptidase [Pseudomonadota bacterium]|nr:M28 family peptidase [Pseudomonadota bacterium]
MFSRFLLAAAPLLLLLSTVAEAQQRVRPDELMRHIRVLASDQYEGREPGTAGGERTEAYLLESFAQAGLAPGAAGGGWRQVVRMIERRPEQSRVSWKAGTRRLEVPEDALVLVGRKARLRLANVPVIFAGYGTPGDVEGVDVDSALLLVLGGNPPGREGAAELRERTAELAAAGARGVIAIVPAAAQWADVKRAVAAGRAVPLDRASPLEGAISTAGAASLLRGAGLNLSSLSEEASRPGFRARRLGIDASLDVETVVHAYEAANIIGRIEGKGRPGEALVLMAHWDHLGLCKPEGAPDRICNGAVDNASGTAILIETARAVAAGARPARSIYFVATTLEERGLLGADAFAASPPPAIERIVAALNIDTTAIAPAGLPVAIIGRGNYPELERVIDSTTRSLGRGVDTDTEANVMVERQDGWALARRNIPAVMATGSVSDMSRLRAYLSGPYHKPEDDLTRPIELGGAVEDTDLHIALARALSDPVRYPAP